MSTARDRPVPRVRRRGHDGTEHENLHAFGVAPIRRVIAAVLLVAAVALAFAATWILVPAPTSALLLLGVVAPEWAPYLALAGVVFGLFAASSIRGRLGLAIGVFGGVTLLLSLPAFVGYPSLVTAADARMRSLPNDRGWPVSPYDPLAVTGRDAITIDDAIPVALRDGTTRLALDLYRPRVAGLHPAVVVIYGGAWAFGDRLQCRPLALDLARAGYAVVMVDYRHAPAYRYPTQVEDVEDALALLARQHASWNVDLSHVAILGRSAGAQIALLLASTPQPVRVAAAVGIYAPIDLAGGYERPPDPDPADVRSILSNYLGGPPDASHRAAYVSASPQSHASTMRAPTLLLTGTRDELVLPRFQRRYAQTLRAAGTPTVAFELPLANHAFDSVPFGRGATFERAVLLRFLHSALQTRDSRPNDSRSEAAP